MKEKETINERRKKKFLDKVKDQNKDYKETKKKSSKNKIIYESDNFSNKNKSKKYQEDINSDDDNNNIDNDNNSDNNNNISNNNHKTSYKINYFDKIKKINKYEYIKNILDLFKKILVIILTLFHCFKYFGLDDRTKLKYSLLVLEISSFLVNKLLRMRMKEFIKSDLKVENEIINISDNKSAIYINLNKLIKFLEKIIKSIIPFKYVFEIFGFVMDILTDISILFITNVIFFIFNEDDE